MTKIIDIIKARRSIRKFQERSVEPEKITQLLEAAMAAPSARNGQPWEFVVVSDTCVLNTIRDNLESGRYNTPVAIAVLANLQVPTANVSSPAFWQQDCTAALENILIAAVGLGLGTVWIGVYPREDRVAAVRRILGIPEHVIPLALIYVGYGDEDKPPRTQYNAERVHWQRYELHQ